MKTITPTTHPQHGHLHLRKNGFFENPKRWMRFLVLPVMSIACFANAQSAQAASLSATWSVSAWSTGYTAYLTIKNNGTTPVNGWSAKFTTSQQETEVWNANLTGPVAKVYTLTDAGWNSTIAANGGTTSVGFTFNGTPPQTPTNFSVNGQSIVLNAPSGGATPTPTPTATPKPTATPTPTATPKPSATPTPTATPKPTATPAPSPTATPSPAPSATPSPTPTPGSVVTSGTIGFHYDFEAGSTTPEDTMVLTGDNYTDLIMSTLIAGTMYGHLIQEFSPGIQINQDYLCGSLFGQLLQENGETEQYTNTSLLIDSAADQQGEMGPNQGGPYQMNDYLADFVGGSDTPMGFSLVNFVALQKNIGYTIAGSAAQYNSNMPTSFNNKYYGPMVAAYAQFDDYRALQYIGGVSLTEPWSSTNHSYTPEWQPYFDEAVESFADVPDNQLDILLNIGYNAGLYSELLLQDIENSANSTTATAASFNSYSNAAGADSYHQYPYQVRSYLDQLFDKPSQSPVNLAPVTFNNHVAFNMGTLSGVFSNVFQTLAYVDGSGNYDFFTAAQATTAFDAALSAAKLSPSDTLDLSNASDRATIFSIIDAAISNLETNQNTSFSSTTLNQL